jgi:hypothetical protein
MIFTPLTYPIGSKLLIKTSPNTPYESIIEAEVLNYAPSNKFVKLGVDDYTQWENVEKDDYEVVEVLPSGKGKKTKQVLKG